MTFSDSSEVPAKRFKLDDASFVPLKDESESLDGDQKMRVMADEEWMAKLRELLECPVCYETIRPSVHVCLRGHSVCMKCRCKLLKCPVCKEEFSETENLMLNNLADFIKYPCLNVLGGCMETYYLRDEARHMLQCKYQVHRCKISTCNWSGPKEALLPHMDIQHKNDIQRTDWSFTKVLKFKRYPIVFGETRNLFVIHDELFWYFCKSDQVRQKLFINFRYVGSREAASTYGYQLCLNSSNERIKFLMKMAMEEDTNDEDWLDSSCCACIDFKTLGLFRVGHKLEFHFFITKLNENQ